MVEENIDYVICPICYKKMKLITNSHLKHHNISLEKFKIIYPNNKIICLNSLNKRIKSGMITSNINKERWDKIKSSNIDRYNETPNYCLMCGIKLDYYKCSENSKLKFCSKSCAAKYNNKLRIHNGYKMSEIQKEAVSNFMINKYNIKDENGNIIPKSNKIRYYNCKKCGKLFVKKTVRCNKYVYCSKKCQHDVFSERAKNNLKLNKNNNRHSGWYESPIAGRVWLESSWEVKIAKSLDNNNIKWVRPKVGFTWVDEDGKFHKYYPDFYLVDYNTYLDPKNPYCIKQDIYKINYVINNYIINLLILNKKELTWETIKTKL